MHLSLGTGLAAGRRGPRPHVPGAPVLVRPPALVGDGRIGADLAADPGDWTGAARIEFAWLKNGAPIPGATGRIHAPTAADDRAALACRITAVGAAGRTVAETPAIAAAHPPPRPLGPMPDLIYTQGAGIRIMDASPFFSGNALSFSIVGDGVSIDPVTGLVTVSLEALRAGAVVRVIAENSGGRTELGFTLNVTSAAADVAPVLTLEPKLAGDGLVGAELTADPGVWAGDPAPELALEWLCDGAPIPDATLDRFTPGETEDGALVAVRVTARNPAGTLTAETPPIGITRAAPEATGALDDVALAQGSDPLALPAAPAFTGDALRFAATGGGAAIDPETGVVTIPTEAARAETVLVTATNSGGAASVKFAVAVLAAPSAQGAPVAAAFAQGGAAGKIAVAGFFAGDALEFALETAPAGVTVDAATGLVTVPTATALSGAVVVRASNAVGAASVKFAVAVLAVPSAQGAPVAAAFAQGGAAGKIAVAGFFAGDALEFALETAPAGVTVDAATGLVTVPTATALSGAVVVRASNAVGAASVKFAVSVQAAPATNPATDPATSPAVTVFDAPEKLAEVSFVQRNAPPSWTYDAAAGWAVFSPGAPSDFTHGAWSQARGDGRYRTLVRINHSAALLSAYTRSRPFGINGRMARNGADMRGIRVELDRRVSGITAFEIREYTGAGEATTLIATAPVAWDYDVWYWMEAEFDGPAVRARLYRADEEAPAWQATATTASLDAGYFGPMSQVFSTTIFPVIHIRRLECHPLGAALAAAPEAAPRLTGAVADARASVGETIRVDVGAAVEGAGLSWSATVDGAAPPAGWTISQEGVLTAPTTAAFARRSVAVTATDAFGASVTATFAVEVDPAAPRLTGALADVAATIGDAVRVDFGAIVAGTGLGFAVDRPWTIDARGLLVVPTTVPLDAAPVTVTATDALGRKVSATFRVTVRAPALVLTVPVGDVAATVGETRKIDVGALVTPKTGLTWTSNRPTWTLSAAGVLTIPTTAVLAAAVVTVTAADAFGQSVTASFTVRVDPAAVPPMTVTTAPRFTPAVAPGTALGAIWNVSEGAFAGGTAPFVTDRRFLRDGVALSAYGPVTAYAIVAADLGKTITARVRRTDSSVPPQVLTVTATGEAVIPAAAPAADFTVNTTAQLLAAMITAAGQAGPKVIACSPGKSLGGVTRLNALVKAGRAADGTNVGNRVTIISADRKNPATFVDKGFEMTSADGFTFDGLFFQNTREDGVGIGWPTGDNAFQMRDCANITVRNCTFSDWQDACNVTRGKNYVYEWNRWQRIGKDSCRFFDRNVNVVVQNNTFTDPRVDTTRNQEGPRHPDYLSLQLAATSQRGNVGVVIRRNFFRTLNHYHQGIFVANDEAKVDHNLYKHVGITITENWLIAAHINTIFVGGAEDVLVERNVVRTFPPGFGKSGVWDPTSKSQPKIGFNQIVKGVARDNVGPWAVSVSNLDAKSVLTRTNNTTDPSETVTPAGMAAPFPHGPYAYE